jgi:hypothetical protein
MNGGGRAGRNLHPVRITALVSVSGKDPNELAADHPVRSASTTAEQGLSLKSKNTGPFAAMPMIPFIFSRQAHPSTVWDDAS